MSRDGFGLDVLGRGLEVWLVNSVFAWHTQIHKALGLISENKEKKKKAMLSGKIPGNSSVRQCRKCLGDSQVSQDLEILGNDSTSGSSIHGSK